MRPCFVELSFLFLQPYAIRVRAAVPIKAPLSTRLVAKIFFAKNMTSSLINLGYILVSGGHSASMIEATDANTSRQNAC